ncbi:MAG: YhdP family protein [Rudaea sp.]
MTWRRRTHHARLFVQALFAVLAITAAVVVGLGQIALPWIVNHPEKISAFLSDKLKRPVTLDRVEGVWEHNGPLLTLHGVHMGTAGAGQADMTIPQAQLKVNFLAPFHRSETWTEFGLVGLDLHLVHTASGDWRLQGLDSAPSAGQDTQACGSVDLGSLVLRNVKLTIDDSTAGRHIALSSDEIRLINSGDDYRLMARVRVAQSAASTVDVIAECDRSKQDGRVYIGGTALDLAGMLGTTAIAGWQLERGDGRAQLWADWSGSIWREVRAEIDLRNVVMTTPQPIAVAAKQAIVPRVGFDRVAFGARWQHTDTGWNADIADMIVSRQGVASPSANIHVEKVNSDDPDSPTFVVAANHLDLGAPASVAMLTDALPESWRHWLYEANPSGDIRAFALRYANGHDFDVAATLDAATWHSVDAIPGVSSLSATLLGDQDAFNVSLPEKTAFGFDTPKVFRQPFRFSNFAGDVAIYRDDDTWRIDTDGLDFEAPNFAGQLRGSAVLPDSGAKPTLDVAAIVTHASVTASHLFWPINSMPPPAVSFLDRAIESGQVTAGRASFRGDLADWPFRSYTGRFEARVDVEDVRFPYLTDWPAAEHLRATVGFVDTTMHIDVAGAQSLGVKVEHAVANLSDLGEGIMEIDTTASGAGKDLLAFIKATPIGQKFGVELLGVNVGGTGKVDFHVQFPMKHAESVELAGTAQLDDADLSDAKYNLRLNHANGDVRFNGRGFLADNLDVTMKDKPAKFRLAIGEFVSDKSHGAEGALHANLPARDLLAYAPMLERYADRVDGVATWNIGFTADNDTVKKPTQRISIMSDLRGVSLDLPAPLAKTTETALPLKLVLDPPTTGGNVDLTLGDALFMHGRLVSATQPFAANITFGADSDAPLPAAGLAIKGNVALLDLSGWLDFSTSGSSDGSGGSDSDVIAGIDVKTDSLRVYERDFGAASFRLTPVKDTLDLIFNGANIEGALHIPTVELRRRGITADLTRLYWPGSDDSEDDNTVSTENPATVPPLHIRIGDFHLGQSNFGQTTVESYPVANGTHFEQVSTHSNNVEMRAHGDWLGRPRSDRSTFSIDLSAKNLGNMLDAFGYAGVVDDGETVAHMEGNWAGPPSTFALARLDGTLTVSVKRGRIPDANPGAGRIFGLFNLASLPRRLTLDFGDFFKSGFAFDSIDAVFTLKSGNAFTSNLEVKGPAADIAVRGRTGLKAKDYDQTMEVTPHTGGALVLSGALVGGPVGAAAGALLQGMFKNVTRNRYSVTGSWDKPVMTLLAKEKIQPARASSKDAAKPTPALRGGGL